MARMHDNTKLLNQDTQIAHLTDAFEYFNATTERLASAYKKLEDEFAGINVELEKKNRQLQQKIEEVDHVRSHLENILHSMTTAVIAVDLDLHITVLNRAAEQMFAVDSNSCTGAALHTVLKLDNCAPEDITKHICGTNTLQEREELLKTCSGEHIVIGISASAIKTGQDVLIGYMVLIRDLREIKELEEKARRSDRLAALGEMAARVAHEIRNPLGGVEGFASLLIRILENDPSNKELAQYIVDGVRSVNHIVSSLLDYARPVYVRKEYFSVDELLGEIASMIHNASDIEYPVRFDVVSEADESGQIFADRVLLQQVLWNLVRNGMQAVEPHGSIRVSYKQNGPLSAGQRVDNVLLYSDSVLSETDVQYFQPQRIVSDRTIPFWHVFTITDNGAGISEQMLPKIFYPFCTTKENGTGLGLSTVYKIVEEHSGKIGVKTKQGIGTSFTVYLPGYAVLQEEKRS